MIEKYWKNLSYGKFFLCVYEYFWIELNNKIKIMAKIHAYLNFNGNCETAFKFYEKVFKTENIGIHRFGDMPADPNFPMAEEDKNKIMNTGIMINKDTMLMEIGRASCRERVKMSVVGGTMKKKRMDCI